MLRKAAVSAEALAHVIDQSVDCVKLLSLEGDLLWMNSNGLCAMEIDDFAAVMGRKWASLWPEDSRELVAQSLTIASTGETARFDAFCPTAKGAPRWWSVTVTRVTGVDGAGTGFLSISRDVTEQETQRQGLLIAADEMRHRLRNTYAMIASLLKGFARGTEAHEEFAKVMQKRLMALSAAQSLGAALDVPSDLGELIPALVDPFETPDCRINTAAVTPFSVSQGQADAIALVIGELAVNSTKHGALAHGGTVDISAEQSGKDIRLVWSESALEKVQATSREGGQGLDLIARIVQTRSGSLTTDWRDTGPVVTLVFPRQG
jgi:two-component sensor histidine kinase